MVDLSETEEKGHCHIMNACMVITDDGFPKQYRSHSIRNLRKHHRHGKRLSHIPDALVMLVIL